MQQKTKTPASARDLAAHCIETCLRTKQPLDDLLEQALKDTRFSDKRDAQLAKAIAISTMRQWGNLQSLLKSFLKEPLGAKHTLLEAYLLCGASQILCLDIPDHAAVKENVDLLKKNPKMAAYAKLANAFFRFCTSQTLPTDPLSSNTPFWLAHRWIKNFGKHDAQAIAQCNAITAPLDISIKQGSTFNADEISFVTLKNGTHRILSSQSINTLPGFDEGNLWAQDTSSRYPVLIMGNIKNKTVLDMCAAPGGKTFQMIDAGAVVTALDRSHNRMKRLINNLERLNLTATTHSCDALDFSSDPFDIVLLDAPCSATGTIQRQPDIQWLKSEQDISSLTQLQARLLEKAAQLTKPEGVLIYSTCSLEPEEGEIQILAFLQKHKNFVIIPVQKSESYDLEKSITAEGFLRILPHHLQNDEQQTLTCGGFFVARLKRIN